MLVSWKVIFDRQFAPVHPTVQAGEKEEKTSVPIEKTVLIMIGAIICAIILQGFLRDGVTNWTPSYISDIFKVSSSAAILSGVVLPVFSILCFQLADVIHRKLLKNEMVCATAFFIVGAVSAVLLAVTDGQSMVVSLAGLALLVGSMHGVNLMLISIVPHYFGRYGKVALVSGILNAGTYVGSALSAYGTAVYTENFGWQSTIFLWSAIALAGAVVCLILKGKWARFRSASE